MLIPKKRVLTAAAFVIVLLAPCPVWTQEAAPPSGKVLAKVNGVSIMEWQIGLMQALFFRDPQKNTRESAAEFRKKSLMNTINAELVHQCALKNGFGVAEGVVDDLVWQYKQSFASLKEYQQALELAGASEENMRQFARQALIAGAYINSIHPEGFMATEEEAHAYFEKNIKDYMLPAAVRIRHILVKTDFPPGSPQRLEARRKAESILKRIRDGEPFSMVARETSDDPVRDRGGDMGYITRGSLAAAPLAPLEPQILAMKAGELAGPIESELGFHIILAEDARPETPNSFGRIRDQLMAALEREKLLEAVTNAANELRPQSTVEILDTP